MRMCIDWDEKELHVTCNELIEAGWFGFDFAKNNRDLVDAGWVVCYYPVQGKYDHEEMPTKGGQLIDSNDLNIGDILRKGQTLNHCDTCTCKEGT